MKLPRFGLIGVWLGVSVLGWSIERLPIEDYARAPDVSRARLSPDGRQLAYVGEHHGLTKLHVLDLTTNQTVRLDLGEETLINGYRREVGEFQWVGDQRLVLTTLANDQIFGVVAVNSDGRKEVAIGGLEKRAGFASRRASAVGPGDRLSIIRCGKFHLDARPSRRRCRQRQSSRYSQG